MAIKYHYLKVRDVQDVVVAEFIQSSILDETAIDRVGKEFEQLVLEAATAKKLLLNFRAIEYMSSAMIGKLILLNKNCKNAKIKFKVCNVTGNILEVFQIMKIGKVIDIQKDEKSAIESFHGPSIGKWFGLS